MRETARIADLPLEVRRQQEVDRQRELGQGLTRRHLATAEDERHYLAVQVARLLRAGAAVSAKLRGQ